jgi:hypothetical protein
MEGAKHPVPGVDYPRTFQEFDEWFGTEAKCQEYVNTSTSIITSMSLPSGSIVGTQKHEDCCFIGLRSRPLLLVPLLIP